MKQATQRKLKQLTCACLLLCTLLLLLLGCSTPVPLNENVLRIVTEQSTWDRMNGQLYVLEKAYEESHDGVDIQVDYIPTEEQEREVYLQQLRTEILQGGGPDCYLLPTDNTLILDEPAQYTYVQIDPLFPDVELAMHNGLFCDISKYYDADNTLKKEGLNDTIMQAGVVDNHRYILPLRYDIPMIFALDHALLTVDLNPDILQKDILTIMEAINDSGDPVLAGGLLSKDLSVFTNLINYKTGNAVLEEATLHSYIEHYQRLRTLFSEFYVDRNDLANSNATENTILMEKLDIRKYIDCEYGNIETNQTEEMVIVGGFIPIQEESEVYTTEYYPLWIGSMQDAFDYIPLSTYEDIPLTITPMCSTEGEIVASVTYYAAVGSGCKNVPLAYDFLRQFLLEDSQWERNRPERNHSKPLKGMSNNTSNDLQYPGLIGNGWPVRDQNAIQELWSIRRKQIYIRAMDYTASDEQKRRMRKIGLMGDLEVDKIPLLDNNTIDQVRFRTIMSDEFASLLTSLHTQNTNNTLSTSEIETLSQQFIWNLRWNVSEG